MEQSHIIFISFARNQQDVKSPVIATNVPCIFDFLLLLFCFSFASPPHYPFVPVFYDVILIGGNTKGKFQILLGVATNCFFTLLYFYFFWFLFFGFYSGSQNLYTKLFLFYLFFIFFVCVPFSLWLPHNL